jgi:hypothetical protein
MSRRALRRARAIRGVVVAASGALLAIGGHLLAGGTMPVHPALLVLIGLAAGACTLLSDREWSFRRLLVALAGIEALVHLTMSLDQASMAAAPLKTTPGPSGWVMLAAHTAAALLAAAGLRRGEAMFWRLVERLRPRPLWPTVGSLAQPARLVTPSFDVPGQEHLLFLVDSVPRRGPPALTAV